jgi:hypothetical protein
VGVQHMARIRCNPPPTIPSTTYRRGGDDNNALPVRTGPLQSDVHAELDLEVFRRELFRRHTGLRGHHTDGVVFGFLLDLLYESAQGEEVRVACISMELGNCKEGYLGWNLCKYFKCLYECVGVFDPLAKSVKWLCW